MDKRTVTVLALAILLPMALRGQDFKIGEGGYFRNEGVDVMAFYDFYPEGHQGGVCIIMNGNRVATNGDLRFEATPGQWQPVPRQISREVGKDAITAKLAFPDSSRIRRSSPPTPSSTLSISYWGDTREATPIPLPQEWAQSPQPLRTEQPGLTGHTFREA